MVTGSYLYHAPSTAFQSPGGGENQLVQTGRYVEARGVAIRPFNPWVDRVDRAGLLHLFGMSREGLQLARLAKAKGVPVALSPICWIEPRAMAALAPNTPSRLANSAKWRLKALVPGWPTWRRDLLMAADVILPNSVAEGEQLVRWFGADPERIRPVPNGVEERFAHADPSLFHSLHGDAEFVLYVGRIEPRKNVLGLVEGVRAAGLPLVVLGDALPGYEAYAAECRRAGSGFTREYFGDRVGYARPDRVAEIAGAVADAWSTGPDPDLAGHVAAHYPWSEVARRTAEAYGAVTR
jgi:glycosyltransferase involved in cell wall biosynthesis